jgi:polyadenylate-binding protein
MTMISQEKTMLYLTDFPLSVTNYDIQGFLSNYKDKIIYINQDQNSKNKDKRKPFSIKVLFKDYESANKCRIEKNLHKIHHKSIRIMWDERDTSIRYNTKNNLFFKNIPKSTTPRQVYEYFMKFGDISSCKITEDENGNHYGYGYITFYKPEDAQKALEESKDKKIFENNILEICYFQKKKERLMNAQNNDNQKLYISNLPEKYTTANLKELCNEYGKVESCNIFIDNLGINFGIVQFSSEQEAKDVLNKLNKKEVDGKILNVKLYQNKYEHKQFLQNNTQRLNEENANCNLHIRNIPLTAKEEDLIKIFGKYGNVLSAKIEKTKKDNNDGKIELVSKGFGYISFDNPESAKNAIEALNGKYLPGYESWSRTLIIELFMTKYERQYAESQELKTLSYYTNMNNQNNDSNYYNYNNFFPMYNNYNNYNTLPQMLQMPMQLNPNMPFRGQRFPMPYRFNNYYGYQPRRGGYYKNFRGNRNNYYYYNKNRRYQNKNTKVEGGKENNKKIDLSEYNKLETEEEKKDFLGEKIFSAIEKSQYTVEHNIDFETIGKITGMIIELPDQKEIIEILENTNILNNRIEEALNLLNGKA